MVGPWPSWSTGAAQDFESNEKVRGNVQVCSLHCKFLKWSFSAGDSDLSSRLHGCVNTFLEIAPGVSVMQHTVFCLWAVPLCKSSDTPSPSMHVTFPQDLWDTTVGLTTKMCCLIGHGQTNNVLVKVVTKDQSDMLAFLEVL